MIGSSPASGAFELPAFGSDPRSSVRALLTGVQTEVPLSLTISRTSEEKDVFAIGGLLSELIESQAGSLSGVNALLGGVGELEGAHLESFWDVEESDVVGDGADDCDGAPVELGLALGSFSAVVGEVLDDTGDGEREAVEA